jgi:SAM-dependent methyltransferase
MGVRSVIEFGCGDGNQLTLAKYPAYLGFDVSETAVERCRKLFAADPAKKFDLMQRYHGERADLTLSLDVIYHLVEDEVFEHYMRALFDASTRYVVIYSSDSDDNRRHEGPHVRHRRFSRWIRQNRADWRLSAHIPNRFPYKGDCKSGSFADFFIYERG